MVNFVDEVEVKVARVVNDIGLTSSLTRLTSINIGYKTLRLLSSY